MYTISHPLTQQTHVHNIINLPDSATFTEQKCAHNTHH